MGELRVRKIQEFIKQEVSKMLLNELKDPRIGFVTVTDARITGSPFISLKKSPSLFFASGWFSGIIANSFSVTTGI